MQKDSVIGTFVVATVLCVVCSVLVSVTAVGLKEVQDANVLLDKQKNILSAAGLLPLDENGEPKDISAEEVAALFSDVEMVVVDIATGETLDSSEIDPATYDQFEAANQPDQRVVIHDYAVEVAKKLREQKPTEESAEAAEESTEEKEEAETEEKFALTPAESKALQLGPIAFRAKYAVIYLVKKDEKLDQVVLPFYGKGLWSTMKGFIAIDRDVKTIRGLTYYAHGETPGLGGEVDNRVWKAKWPGKSAFDVDGNVIITIPKAGAADGTKENVVDGLSGATITTKGIDTMVRYWLGPAGFGPFLEKVRKGEING